MSKSLIEQFIIDDETDLLNSEELIERVLKFGRVTKQGGILIEQERLSQDQKLKLCLVLRYLANTVDESISEILRPSELTKVLGERMESVGSRLSILARDGFAKRIARGEYKVYPYKVPKFIEEIENRDESKDTTNKVRKTIDTKSKKSRAVSSVGKDIQQLIDDDFFTEPKLISEVMSKLKEEVKFHDPRLVDKTIRESFVAKKKILKRIPNEKKGRAKWKYVIR